jgi:glycosyltransferase involved in cell wall biosynthesis
MVNFFIIASGYNCQGLDVKCIKSVLAQTYPHFDAWFVNDGSNDKTLGLKELDWINDRRINVWHHLTNEGAAKRRFEVIRNYVMDKDVVILLLGLDDELLPNSLERISQEYEKGKWMTYGNWKNQYGKMLPKGFLNFDEETHRHRNYRKVKYRSTAPNTFKRFLFDQLTEEDFKIDGKWIDSTTESALMFACLEMCGKEKIGVIEDPIYLYNEGLPGGTLSRLGTDYKYKILSEIMKREKKELMQPNTVDALTWEQKAQNLIDRRAANPKKSNVKVTFSNALSDYGTHIRKCHIGKNVLDVGCGDQYIKKVLPEGTIYFGMDAYPQSKDVIRGKIEDCDLGDQCVETVYAFAMLDNVQDFKKAIEQMKRVSSKNIVILTGIGIEPDQYHTMKITEEMLYSEMEKSAGFVCTYHEYLAPKVLLIEFSRA